jgi:hypothetical protein
MQNAPIEVTLKVTGVLESLGVPLSKTDANLYMADRCLVPASRSFA